MDGLIWYIYKVINSMSGTTPKSWHLNRFVAYFQVQFSHIQTIFSSNKYIQNALITSCSIQNYNITQLKSSAPLRDLCTVAILSPFKSNCNQHREALPVMFFSSYIENWSGTLKWWPSLMQLAWVTNLQSVWWRDVCSCSWTLSITISIYHKSNAKDI